MQIGHNCQIGQHNLLISQVGIAGSATTGDYVVLAGQVGVADHVHVGDRAVVGMNPACIGASPMASAMLGGPGPAGRPAELICCAWKAAGTTA